LGCAASADHQRAGAYFTPLVSGVPTPIFFTRLVYLCLLLIVVGWVWAYYSTRGFSPAARGARPAPAGGAGVEERFKLSNRFPFVRLWVEVRDESQLPGNSGSRVLSLIGPRQQRSYIAYTMLNRRGSFHLGPTHAGIRRSRLGCSSIPAETVRNRTGGAAVHRRI
jgi:hypothetical protein